MRQALAEAQEVAQVLEEMDQAEAQVEMHSASYSKSWKEIRLNNLNGYYRASKTRT